MNTSTNLSTLVQGEYVDLVISERFLLFTLTQEGRASIALNSAYFFFMGAEEIFIELTEDLRCNGHFEIIQPAEIGALTDSLILGIDVLRDEATNEIISAEHIYWRPEYEVKGYDLLDQEGISFQLQSFPGDGFGEKLRSKMTTDILTEYNAIEKGPQWTVVGYMLGRDSQQRTVAIGEYIAVLRAKSGKAAKIRAIMETVYDPDNPCEVLVVIGVYQGYLANDRYSEYEPEVK